MWRENPSVFFVDSIFAKVFPRLLTDAFSAKISRIFESKFSDFLNLFFTRYKMV